MQIDDVTSLHFLNVIEVNIFLKVRKIISRMSLHKICCRKIHRLMQMTNENEYIQLLEQQVKHLSGPIRKKPLLSQ